MYYENYIIIDIPIPNYDEIRKKYFDSTGNKIVLLNDKNLIESPSEYFTPVMLMDPTGNIAISSIVWIMIGAALLSTAGVITYGAVTDTPVVFDFSLSAGMGAGLGIKGGISLVWNIRKCEVDLYPHLGVFAGMKYNTFGFSYSVGAVQNYDKHGDYKGPFTDMGPVIMLD